MSSVVHLRSVFTWSNKGNQGVRLGDKRAYLCIIRLYITGRNLWSTGVVGWNYADSIVEQVWRGYVWLHILNAGRVDYNSRTFANAKCPTTLRSSLKWMHWCPTKLSDNMAFYHFCLMSCNFLWMQWMWHEKLQII